MLARDAEDPHESDDAISRTWFEDASPIPVICRRHEVVSVHSVVPVKGPEIWNGPTSNK
jgi:hypothetical protein